jgi:dTDP-4-amino-4,6-dideoxygalactose transaminase
MILMNDFKAEPPKLREAMVSATQRVLESGWYALGKEVQAFERSWADLCGVAYGVGVGNGMDAIEIGLRTLEIGPGDEVITTPMTAFATVLAIFRTGATPVLADIDPDTALLSQESVKRCLTARTRAVVLVHLYGQVGDLSNWIEFCKEHEVALVEDCAQAHLAGLDGKKAGSFGRFGAFSFYPTKNLGAVGDAGMLVTNEAMLAEKAMILRNYGQSVRYEHPELGLNSRLDELHAAILSERLKWLPAFTARRREIAAAYCEEISNPCVKLLVKQEADIETHVHHLFVIRCERRGALQQHLHSAGIQTLIHYPIPAHMQEPCRTLLRDPHGLQNSEYHAAHCLSIPCHPQMKESDVAQVIDAINSFPGA